MQDNFLVFKSLFDIWRSRNFDIYFYFSEIFPKALAALSKKTAEGEIRLEEKGSTKYKALFVPVGFSIENVALISALLKPDYLRLAFTEGSRRFHRKHIHLVKESIRGISQALNISEDTIMSDDQKHTEETIVRWVGEMKTGYGILYSQMAIDLSGGTKPISIGAHNAALSFNDIPAFYLRTEYDEDTQWPIPGTETLIELRKEKSQVDKDAVFVIMPFAKEYDELYQWITDVVSTLNMRCLRVDKEIFIGGIIDKIREEILKAGVVIAELSEENLNVYYELGFSHGYNKKVIMLTQSIERIPFDLRHLRMSIYERDNKSKFIKELSEAIRFVNEDRIL